MSADHDSLPIDPRFEALLRAAITTHDLRPDQDARVRTRLGLRPRAAAMPATATLPENRRATVSIPAMEHDVRTAVTTSNRRPRQQWLQFALAAVAFIAVGLLLTLLFSNGNDASDGRPGTTASPEATTTRVTEAIMAVRDALAPLSTSQERRIVLDVEAQADHDNAFDRWTVELWERWSSDGVLDQGLFVSDPSGEVAAHIVLDGQQSLMNWEPRDGRFDTPLEYSLQRRVLGATLAAMTDPDASNLRSEERDGYIILHYEWSDEYENEFNDGSLGEVWIDPETGRIQRIVHLIDRPDQEPYPTRTFTIRDIAVLPAGSSPAGTYEIEGAIPTPNDSGTYVGITVEQAQRIVPFEIVMPTQVPADLELPSVVSVVDRTPFFRVEAFFELTGDESPRKSIQFTQYVPSGSDLNMPEAETTMTVVNGIDVNQTTGVNTDGDPLLAYWWEHNGIGYQILAAPEGDLTPELIEALMQSILATATAVDEEPPVLPTPDEMGMYRSPEQATDYALEILGGRHWDNPNVAAGLEAVNPVITGVEREATDGELFWVVELTGRFDIHSCPVRRLPTPGTSICDVGDRATVAFQASDGLNATVTITFANRDGTVSFTVNSSTWMPPTPTP